MTYKKFEKLEVFWIDSIHDAGWINESAYDDDDKWMQMTTAGYFLKKTKKAIHIIQSKQVISQRKGHLIDSIMQIPLVAVTKIKKLR